MLDHAQKNITPTAEGDAAYHRLIRVLHWLMALGFVMMWATGVFVTNIEGVPFWVENDRQGIVRDFHKSIGLTLLALLVLRFAARLAFPPPALPNRLSGLERGAAHFGHYAIYAIVVMACLAGYAIADLQEYENAYFGVTLPPIFPKTETVAGWSVAPWSYILHAVLTYGLLALVLGHVLFVVVHRHLHKVDLMPRILRLAPGRSGRFLSFAATAVVVIVILVSAFSLRAFITLGAEEEPRDYVTTTPFAN